jgi:hypothetical protein
MNNDYLSINRQKIRTISKYWHLLTNDRHYHPVFWFLIGLMLVLGDTKLVLTTGLSVGIMLIFYQSDQVNWQIYLFKLSQFLSGINRKLILAVSSGGLMAIISYLILSIWSNLDNHWLATALILQGLITTTGLSLLTWYLWQQQNFTPLSSTNTFANLVINLTAVSPLKRLFSLNQLIELWEQEQLTFQQIRQLKDYFELMLKTETEPVILNKIEDTLCQFSAHSNQKLNLSQPLNLTSQPKQTDYQTVKYQTKVHKIGV